MSSLGRLSKVELRDIWKSEAQHFTPWLAEPENLLMLGETLGIDLEREAVEQNVGPFRADILCRNTLDASWVLIENQLERTDHSHLGQLITYASGLEAVTIIWIAARFSEEHRAALDWLNQHTAEGMRFFGLEIELWKIGESMAAPKFNIVSKPNAWSQTISAAKNAIADGTLSATRQLQKEYWDAFETKLAEQGSQIRPRAGLAAPWISHSIGKSGVTVNSVMSTQKHRIRAEIYLAGIKAKQRFRQLLEMKSEIESRLGFNLDWQELPEKLDCRICCKLDQADPSDRGAWVTQHDWLATKLIALHSVFKPYIANLDDANTLDEAE